MQESSLPPEHPSEGLDAPWRLDTLKISDFRTFERLDISFSWPVTAIAGTNGTGKTAILDALAVMLTPIVKEFGGKGPGFTKRDARLKPHDLDSIKSVARLDPTYPVEATATGTLASQKAIWNRKLSSAKGRTTQAKVTLGANGIRFSGPDPDATDTPWPVFAYYSIQRLTGARRAQGRITTARSSAYDASLIPQSDQTRLFSFFRSLDEQINAAQAHGDAPPIAAIEQFEAITEACNKILSDIGWRRPRWNPSAKEITLVDDNDTEVPFSWLASGPKIAAGLAIDLASRMARANPNRGKELLKATPGIVLIDEVDLHLHPGWQQTIVPTLIETFPQTQFIITTHSPQVLSTIEGSAIRILGPNGVEIPPYAEGLRSDIVLREIQNVDARPRRSEKRVKLEAYLEAVYSGEGDSESSRLMREQLDAELGGKANVPELLEADAHMAISSLDW